MALYKFTKNTLAGKPMVVFNNDTHTGDFIHVAVIRSSDQIAHANPAWDSNNPGPATSNAPFRIFNIGNNPIKLDAYINAIETALEKKAIKDLLPLQPGDVPDTFAVSSDYRQYFKVSR